MELPRTGEILDPFYVLPILAIGPVFGLFALLRK